MTTSPQRVKSAPVPLAKALRRTQIIGLIFIVFISNLLLTATGLLEMRRQAISNGELVAKSIAYTSSAAVVFRDRQAAMDIITRIAQENPVEAVALRTADGKTLASWQAAQYSETNPVSRIINPVSIRAAVLNNGRVVGEVEIRRGIGTELSFILKSFIWTFLCITISVLAALSYTRRVFSKIVEPLSALLSIMREVRTVRSWHRRLPPAHITEFNELATDFNALLQELEQWEAGMQSERRSLHYQATHDALTGLPNRALFQERLNTALVMARIGQEKLALLYVDCNDFKSINDTRGHHAGDAVLTELAARLRSVIRTTDFVARLGGDEFAILLHPFSQAPDLQRIRDSINGVLTDPVLLDNEQPLQISVSVGVACFPEDALDGAALMRVADGAMYSAKRATAGKTIRLKTGTTSE